MADPGPPPTLEPGPRPTRPDFLDIPTDDLHTSVCGEILWRPSETGGGRADRIGKIVDAHRYIHEFDGSKPIGHRQNPFVLRRWFAGYDSTETIPITAYL